MWEKQCERAERRRAAVGSQPRVWLPPNAKGPGIAIDTTIEPQGKYAYGREAAAAVHSAIKDDMKRGKVRVYSNPSGQVGKWERIQHKRCKGFVHCNGRTGRCYNYIGPKDHRFRCALYDWCCDYLYCGCSISKSVLGSNRCSWAHRIYAWLRYSAMASICKIDQRKK